MINVYDDTISADDFNEMFRMMYGIDVPDDISFKNVERQFKKHIDEL